MKKKMITQKLEL
ncbi:mCG8135, partial [Mus musculus]